MVQVTKYFTSAVQVIPMDGWPGLNFDTCEESKRAWELILCYLSGSFIRKNLNKAYQLAITIL